MRVATRWSVVAVCLAAALSGCGSGVDLAKSTGKRTTVPAAAGLGGQTSAPGTGGSAPPSTGEQAFASANLRLLNPCEVMPEETLRTFGTPANNRLRDYVLCSNYMKDTAGKELNFTLTIGDLTVGRSSEGEFKVGGLPAVQSELEDKTACFVTAVTETNPARGITVQTGGPAGDLCTPGRGLLEAAVARIREGAPRLELAKGSLVELEPCTILPDERVAGLVGESASKRPLGLHQCSWSAQGVTFTLSFKIGVDPERIAEAAETTAVDLGSGVRAQQRAENESSQRCRLEWAHVPYPTNPDDQSEVVTFDLTRYSGQTGDDPCAAVQAAAKELIPKLPAK